MPNLGAYSSEEEERSGAFDPFLPVTIVGAGVGPTKDEEGGGGVATTAPPPLPSLARVSQRVILVRSPPGWFLGIISSSLPPSSKLTRVNLLGGV